MQIHAVAGVWSGKLSGKMIDQKAVRFLMHKKELWEE
jgi:hypothetical protein